MMPQALEDLVTLLKLERLEEHLFRGHSQDLGFPQLFGGQVLGQALSAATQTLDSQRRAHSLHGYFLHPGDARQPVIYQVDPVRDGGSFTTRRVSAIQHGRTIFFCSASFQGEEDGLTHQLSMPGLEDPDTLIAAGAKVQRFKGRPIEFIQQDSDTGNGQEKTPRQRIWFRLKGELPKDENLHRYLLAYSSDFNLLTTALVAHGVAFTDPRLQIASLDHALWLHQHPQVNDWLLYDLDSPWAGGARGFSRGSIFDRRGHLIASTAQEGLIRMREPKR